MSLTKRYLEQRSEEIGYSGELSPDIIQEIQDQDVLKSEIECGDSIENNIYRGF
jgi:hypothetical protein